MLDVISHVTKDLTLLSHPSRGRFAVVMGKDLPRKGGGRKQRRGAKKLGLERGSGGLASTLLKAIGASEDRRKASVDAEDAEEVDGDVYEYEEGVPEEERGKNKRFDDVDRLEYELPSDFEVGVVPLELPKPMPST